MEDESQPPGAPLVGPPKSSKSGCGDGSENRFPSTCVHDDLRSACAVVSRSLVDWEERSTVGWLHWSVVILSEPANSAKLYH